jgi:hypothetical protein
MSHSLRPAQTVEGSAGHDCPANVLVTVTPPDFMKFTATCCVDCLVVFPLDKITDYFPGCMVSARIAPPAAV